MMFRLRREALTRKKCISDKVSGPLWALSMERSQQKANFHKLHSFCCCSFYIHSDSIVFSLCLLVCLCVKSVSMVCLSWALANPPSTPSFSVQSVLPNVCLSDNTFLCPVQCPPVSGFQFRGDVCPLRRHWGGAVVLWCSSALELWCSCAVELLCSGALYCCGALVLCCCGALVL